MIRRGAVRAFAVSDLFGSRFGQRFVEAPRWSRMIIKTNGLHGPATITYPITAIERFRLGRFGAWLKPTPAML